VHFAYCSTSQTQLLYQKFTDRNAVRSCSLFSCVLTSTNGSYVVTIESVSLFATHLVSLYTRYSQKVVQQASDSCQPPEGQSWLAQKLTRFSTNVNHTPSFTVAQDGTTALPATNNLVQRNSAHWGHNCTCVRKRKYINISETFGPIWINVGRAGVYKTYWLIFMQFRPTIAVFWQDVHCSSVLAVCSRCPLSDWSEFTVSYWMSAQDVHCSSVLAVCSRCPLSDWSEFTVGYWMSAQVRE
jgi:hypothetical protein